MAEARVVTSIEEIGRDAWDALFVGELETFDYLLAVERSGLEGFHWRYVIVEENGRLLAAAPAFLTNYALDTTLSGGGKRLVAAARVLFPRALTLRLGCLGSPCTETVLLGFAPDLAARARISVLRCLHAGFERAAFDEGCSLLAVKDVPSGMQGLWSSVLNPRGYRPIPGLPVAHLDIDFENVDAYLARLSSGTRKDMRRKLRALERVRVEIRHDLDGVLDRVISLYHQTRTRAEMQFETLVPAYFTGVTSCMRERAFYVLYYSGDELLAVNLLLQGGDTLLDKFFCMDAERGRALNLYFLSWFTNLNFCLERGLKRYQSGQAAYENKLRLGSELTRTAMYFRHSNALINGALRLAAPLFAADPVADRGAA